MGVTFTITYTHRKFAALEAEKTLPGEKPNGDILWPYPLDSFISHNFEKFQPPGCNNEYSGGIEIKPIRFVMDSFYKDKDRALEMQKTPQGWVRLPTIVVQAKIHLEGIPKSIIQTIKWQTKVTEEIDYNKLAKDQVNKQYEFLKASMGGEKELFEYVLRNREKPEKIFILARMDDEEYEDEFGKKVRKSKEPDLMDDEKEILRLLLQWIQSMVSIPDFDFRLMKVELDKQIPYMAMKMERDDRDGRKLRWYRYWKILRENSAISKRTSRKPQYIDAGELELFGIDLFNLFRYYWNLIIRYYKYEKMQHWIDELSSYSKGLFFIKHPVLMDDEYPVLPYAIIHFDLMLNTDVAHYISKSDWEDSLLITNNYSDLLKYAGGFEIGGIFSQSFQALTDREFEKAVVLAIIGLDASMTEVMHRIDTKEAIDKRDRTPGPKIGYLSDYFRGKGKLDFENDEYEKAWKHISSPDDATGLLELRNAVVHKDMKLPGHDIELRKRLLTRLSSARLMSYRLISWSKDKPRIERKGKKRKRKKSTKKKP